MPEAYGAPRAAEERLRQLAAIVEQSNDAIVSYAPDGTITSWNPGAERLYGFSAAEVLGRHPDEFPPPSGEVTRLLQRAAAGEPVQNYETVQLTSGGEQRVVSLTLSPIHDRDGTLSGFSGIARDITGRKQTEATLRRQNGYLGALHDLTLGLVNRLDVADLLDAVVTRAAALLEAEDGFIYLVRPGGDAMVTTAASGRFQQWLGRKIGRGEGLAGRVWQTGEPLAVEHYAAWEGRSPAPGREHLRAVVGAPLRSGEQVIGVLGLARSTIRRAFGQEEIAVLGQFAQLATVALENARLYEAAQQELEERRRVEEALRESEERFRAVFDGAAIGIARCALDGTIHAANPALERMLGYGSGELERRSFADILHPSMIEQARAEAEAMLSGAHDHFHYERRYLRRDGRDIWVSITASLVRDAERRVRFLIVMAEDIDERRRAEELLRRQNSYLAALHETTLALMNRLDLAGMLETIVTRAAALLDVPHGYIYRADPDTHELVAIAGVGIFRERTGRRLPFGVGVGGRVWQTGQAIAVDDYATWADAATDPSLRGTLHAMAGVPLHSGGEVAGVIGLVHTDPERRFGEQELAVLGQFAQLASLALDNARLYQAAQQELDERRRAEAALRRQNDYQAALHELTLALMNRVEVADLIEAVVQRAAALLNASDAFICLVSADGEALELAATTGDLRGRHARRLQRGEGMAGTVWETGEPLVIDDYTHWERGVSLNDLRTAVHATVGIPLLSAGAVVGVLGLSRPRHGSPFRADEVEILTQFARLAALALENARLHEAARQELEERRRAEMRLRRENEYRAALHEITLGLMQRHDVADLLDTIVTRATALLGTAHGFVNLVSADGASLETTAGTGMFREQLGTRMGHGQGLAGSVLATGEPMLVPDYTAWRGRLAGSERDVVRACGAAPLRAGAEVVGVLGLAFTDPEQEFGSEELAVLVQFAQLASIAYDNARLYQSSRQEIDERRRAEERLRRENEYRAALHETALGLLNRLDVDDLLNAIVTRAAALVEALDGYIFLLEPEKRRLRTRAGSGIYRDRVGRGVAIDEGLGGEVMRSGRPLAVEDYYAWRGHLRDLGLPQIFAIAGVPLHSGEHVVGVLGVSYREPGRAFGPEQIAVLGQFAQLASLVLDNARLYSAAQQELAERTRAEEQLRRQNEYQAALHETALGLINRLDVAEVLNAIVARSAALLGGDHGYIDLVTPDAQWLELTAATGLFSDEIGRRFKPGEGVVGSVWASGEPLAVAGYNRWEGRLPGGVRDAVRAAVGVPLKSGEQVIGVIGLVRVNSDAPFGQDEIAALGQFARLAVVALDNARLYQEARSAEEGLRRQLEFTGAITNNLGEGVLALDGEGRVTLANPSALRMLGWDSGGLAGTSIQQLLAAASEAPHPVALAIAGGVAARVEDAIFVRRDGTPLPVSFSASPIMSDGRAAGTVIAFHDITERKAQTAALEHQAQHDALTGLPNRVLLRDRLEQAIRTAGREALPLALLVMDLDGFKEVNDTLGHQMGDVLLQHVARRLQDALRTSDTVARMGGDEFAILLPGDAQTGAQIAAQKLLEALEQPFPIDGYGIDVGASIGIAVYPDHGLDAQTLLRRADVAMYVAKRGKRGAVLYTSEQDQHSPDRLALLGDMRSAIEGGQLVLSFQPICDIRTRQVLRLEALAGWRHPRRGLIPPHDFIPLAEQTGLIGPLTRWLLGAALQTCSDWRTTGHAVGVAVKLSVRTLHERRTAEMLAELLATHRLPPAAVTLEINESALVPYPQRAIETLMRLHALGVRIAIDDFGTGYSSLAYLKRLPVDEVKIDRSFVLDMLSDPNDAAIARATIDLAHNLGLQITAEGIENSETLAALRTLGCDTAQGLLLGEPLEAEQLPAWLADR